MYKLVISSQFKRSLRKFARRHVNLQSLLCDRALPIIGNRHSRDKDNPAAQGLIDLAETIAQFQQTNLQ